MHVCVCVCVSSIVIKNTGKITHEFSRVFHVQSNPLLYQCLISECSGSTNENPPPSLSLSLSLSAYFSISLYMYVQGGDQNV